MEKGIVFALTDCNDPDRQADFNGWYSYHFVPHVIQAEGVVRARRFTNARPGMGPAQYIALYDIEAEDFESAARDFRRRGRDELQKSAPEFFSLVGSSIYRHIAPGDHPPPREEPAYPSKGGPSGTSRPAPSEAKPLVKTTEAAVYMVMSHCQDPAREDEFNSWYNHIHVPDLTPAKGCVGGTRWRNVSSKNDPSTYAAIYEFAADDLVAAMTDFQRLGTATMKGRIIDCMQSVGMWWWWEVDAEAYR